jgi:hypothetical protein
VANIQGVDVGPNVAVGQQALESNTVASANTAVGYQALRSFTSGYAGSEQVGMCTAVGFQALANTQALPDSASGFGNTGFGYRALFANTTSFGNTAIGSQALHDNTEGRDNTAVGRVALANNTTAGQNTAVGLGALFDNTTGENNTAVGAFALDDNTVGSGNTAIGHSAGTKALIGNRNVYIGVDVVGVQGEDDTTGIRNIGSTPLVGVPNVLIAGTGGIGAQRLGYASSSRRYKEEIKPMDKASETLFALKPVTFRAKAKTSNPGNVKLYGLIAEDVAAVDSDLVVYNPEGKPEALRFDSINAMLLNEFLKEHKKVEQLEKDLRSTIAQQQKQIESLTASLKRVSAELAAASPSRGGLEMTKPALQTVLYNQ